MSDPAPPPELLRSLGKLVRGLTALFWGLPLALLFTAQNYLTVWMKSLGVVLPVVLTGMLFYGLWLMGDFQKQERVWLAALDRAKFTALALVGLSPFVYWRNQLPSEPYFVAAMTALFAIGLLFIYNLNVVLLRLTAMLQDETLRADARTFTALNRGLLLAILVLSGVHLGLLQIESLPEAFRVWLDVLDADRQWMMMLAVLFPVAVTMSLIWKVKEAVLASVFGGSQN
ncbi:MAG: hypothetical protein HY301_17640 [Verrucomicrobia bacterium]|nr:hypothetical protein [Verrucomicrobiota bacterium]